MSETRNLVMARLPPCLSAIVLGYFQTGSRSSFVLAQAGEYEACAYIILRDEHIFSNWDQEILVGACDGGHLELAQFAVKFVANPALKEQGMRLACNNNHLDLATFMFKYVSAFETDNILFEVLKNGQRELAWILINLGKHRDPQTYMIAHGQIELFRLSRSWPCFSEATLAFYLAIACLGNQAEMIRFIVEQGAIDCGLCGRSSRDHLAQAGPK